MPDFDPGLRVEMKPGPDGAKWFMVTPDIQSPPWAIQIYKNDEGYRSWRVLWYDSTAFLQPEDFDSLQRALARAAILILQPWEKITQLVLDSHSRRRRAVGNPWHLPQEL